MAPRNRKPKSTAPTSRGKKNNAAPEPSESSAHSPGSSSLSPVKSAHSIPEDDGTDPDLDSKLLDLLESGEYDVDGDQAGDGGGGDLGASGIDGAATDGFDVDMEMDTTMDDFEPQIQDFGAALGVDTPELGAEGEGEENDEENEAGDEEEDENGDEEDDEDDEEEGDEDDDEEEEEEEGDDEGEEEDDEGDDQEEADVEDDDEDDDGGEDEDDDSTVATIKFRYPAAVPDFVTISDREKAFKVARFVACTASGCDCPGLAPPEGAEITLVSREQMIMEGGYRGQGMTSEGWWSVCGSCGHGWEGEHGHVFPAGLAKEEKVRRGRVVGRIEELLQDDDLLTIFPTPQPESIESLLRQLQNFQRPTGGKKPVAPLPAAIDMRDSATPFTPRGEDDDDGAALHGSDDESRPRKRTRRSGSAEDGEVDNDEAAAVAQAGKTKSHGKKPGGKTAGKGTKPRTVVRAARGLIPMEIDAEGNQHVAGRLPDSAVEDGAEEEDDDDDDVPLAQRPQLDEGERRRREVIKEKEREREDEVLRRLAKGTNAEDGAEGMGRAEPGVDVEVWEGVELPKLPPRPAMVEEQKGEIRLIVTASTHPGPVAKILLIGLKNLFQRQLPKMPREYITRLVLDKKHISVAIVKKGWKVVGGICYRPFESRSFAEIVFCAIDSSEQIKGYGSHLMNSLKDVVRRDQPTINHFLTYADNYAVGYFKKQGFTKEISLDRAKWVGYIKDYEGGTIMQCTMLPKVKYLDVHQMLADQKAAVLAKIRTISRSHVVRPGLEIFKDVKPGKSIILKKEDVPGLAESGWNPEIDEILRQPRRNPDHVLLQHVLNDLQNEPSAWPFTKPVDRSVVLDYDEVIKEPMDLSTMEFKLESNHYSSVEDFLQDARLIFSNCRQYNGERSTYTTQANKLEKALDRILKARQASR